MFKYWKQKKKSSELDPKEEKDLTLWKRPEFDLISPEIIKQNLKVQTIFLGILSRREKNFVSGLYDAWELRQDYKQLDQHFSTCLNAYKKIGEFAEENDLVESLTDYDFGGMDTQSNSDISEQMDTEKVKKLTLITPDIGSDISEQMDTEKVKKLTFGQKLGNLMSKLKKPKKEKTILTKKETEKQEKKLKTQLKQLIGIYSECLSSFQKDFDSLKKKTEVATTMYKIIKRERTMDFEI